MRTLVKATLGLSFIGAMAMGPTVPVQAQGFYLDAPGDISALAIRTTTVATTTIPADGAHGMDVRRIGPFRAASVSPIGMVHGTTGMDGIVKHSE